MGAKSITEQPEWMISLSESSYLNGRDMLELFGIENKATGLDVCIKNGTIPPPTKPDMSKRGPFKYGRTKFVHTMRGGKTRQWSVADLRKFFKTNQKDDHDRKCV